MLLKQNYSILLNFKTEIKDKRALDKMGSIQ